MGSQHRSFNKVAVVSLCTCRRTETAAAGRGRARRGGAIFILTVLAREMALGRARVLFRSDTGSGSDDELPDPAFHTRTARPARAAAGARVARGIDSPSRAPSLADDQRAFLALGVSTPVSQDRILADVGNEHPSSKPCRPWIRRWAGCIEVPTLQMRAIGRPL